MTKKKALVSAPSKLKFKKTSTGTEVVEKSAASKALLAPRVKEAKLYGENRDRRSAAGAFPEPHSRSQVHDRISPARSFTCICPRSGFPDFATIRIKYIPDQHCVELKSLKLYINSFRDKKVFHEDVTNSIIQDMIDLLDPSVHSGCRGFHRARERSHRDYGRAHESLRKIPSAVLSSPSSVHRSH